MAFHVPEQYRLVRGPLASTKAMGNSGAFLIPPPAGKRKRGDRNIFVIASDGMGWEHVSCHIVRDKDQLTPLWNEMCYIKDMFWDDEDVVMQLHPKQSEYVNQHAHTLHLWRPINIEIPTPPSFLVGIKGG